MDRILIRGGRPLCGEIDISGSKNAALPLMAAALLAPQTLRLSNLPRLADIASMRRLLETLGAEVREVSGEPDERGMADEAVDHSPAGSPDSTETSHCRSISGWRE